MRDIWSPRRTRIVQRSSEAEVDVEATRSLYASAEAFLDSADLIVAQMRAPPKRKGDDPEQYLRAVAHFVLGTGYELTLKLMLRQSGVVPPKGHKLVPLYDAIRAADENRARLDHAYETRMASLSESEATVVVTRITAGDPRLKADPHRPALGTIRGWFDFMDEKVRHHVQRFAWEDRRDQRATQHFADLSPFCDILRCTLASLDVPPEPDTPHTVVAGVEDRMMISDSVRWSESPCSG